VDAPYVPGKRLGMVKIKRMGTVDCVVMGWRPGKAEGTAGSLILALSAGDDLRPVGHCAGFPRARKVTLRDELAPYETGGPGTGAASRGDAERALAGLEM